MSKSKIPVAPRPARFRSAQSLGRPFVFNESHNNGKVEHYKGTTRRV
jgi:hypothetical protein